MNKRFLRELKGELAKYIVIFVFMTAVIGLISGFLIADGSMYDTYNKSFEKYNIEDGNFELYSKADESVIDKLEKENVTIYENFYKEETVVRHNNIKNDEDSQSTLRFYVNREEVDKVDLMEGSLPEDINEIAIDRMYAENNDIKVQDTLTVGSRILKVTGLVALSDYSSLFSDNSDTMFDSLKFGVGVVSQKCFDAYDDTHIHYVYSWLYDNKPEDDKEAKLMADDFVKTISANAILVNYIPQYINQAIHFTGDDIGSDRSMMIVLLYVLIVIMAFVFAVTTNNTIVKEANVIGTLRASGYTRGELLRHYILLPIIVTIFGALVGNILGYTVFKDIFVATYYGSYSFPTYHTLWNADAFLLTTVVPVIIMLVINIVIIGCRLKLSPLKFLRRDLSGKQKKKAMRLPAFGFFNRFRLRIIIQNMPNYITLFIGILFANVLLLFGIMLGPMLTHYQNEITDKLIAKHQYVLKTLVDVDDNAAEKYCVKTLATIEGRLKSEDVLVYGVKDNSIYADINTASLKDNEVYITNGYADKFRIKKGDKITLKEKYDDNEYEFTVKDMYDYPSSFAIFMSDAAFKNVFDKSEDYYSGYFSDNILDIDEKYVATQITLDDLTKVSRQLDRSMGETFNLVKIFAVVLFAVLMFLLTKLIVEKNTTSISMVKILGYSNREISRLYVTSTTIVVVLSVALSIGLSVVIMNYLFRVFMEEMSGWISCYYAPHIFPVMFILNITVYAVISFFMMAKIKKIPMDEALKTVE
ncbi:aBC-type transport system involved in lipoprotein release permease component [Eubacterium sp. CAG:248]|nr:aBC-type transport system involved in lipoprotein release permease component [Eubacterium sp. CAG:248]